MIFVTLKVNRHKTFFSIHLQLCICRIRAAYFSSTFLDKYCHQHNRISRNHIFSLASKILNTFCHLSRFTHQIRSFNCFDKIQNAISHLKAICTYPYPRKHLQTTHQCIHISFLSRLFYRNLVFGIINIVPDIKYSQQLKLIQPNLAIHQNSIVLCIQTHLTLSKCLSHDYNYNTINPHTRIHY